MLALLAAGALPLIGLVVWFTWIDSPSVGEDRCASCGVEDYVAPRSRSRPAGSARSSPGPRPRRGSRRA
jgi:hypothetical protein